MNGLLHKCIVGADGASSNTQIAHKCCLNHEWTNMFRFHPVFGAVAKCPYQYEHLKGARALQESPDSLQQACQNMDEYQCLVLQHHQMKLKLGAGGMVKHGNEEMNGWAEHSNREDSLNCHESEFACVGDCG